MKKTLTLLLVLLGLVPAIFASTIPIFEPFADSTGVSGGTAYTANTGFLSHQTNALLDSWWAINTGTANANSNVATSVVMTNLSLSYAGLPASTGNAIVIPKGTSGLGARVFLTNGASPITAVNYSYGTNASGVTVYYSMILQVPNLTSLSTSGDFCFGFNNQQTIAEQSGNPGNWAGKVWFKKNGAGYNLGVSKMGNSAANATFDNTTLYTTSDQVFVVVGYTINSGNVGTPGDDVVKLWVNPSSTTFGSLTAPAATVTGTSSSDSDQNNGGLDCFQIGVRSGTQPDILVMDELRIGTNWAQVTGGPFFKTTPGNTSVNFGATLSLTAKASGNGSALTYQWQKNGSNLTDGGDVSGTTTATLNVANATQATAGTYSLIISNLIGSATNSTIVTITGDPRVVTPPSAVAVAPSSSITFNVGAIGTPALVYQWKRNGINLADGSGLTGTVYTGAQTPTLSLDNIDLADNNAIYSCAVTNGLGSGVVSSGATLTVNDPAITSQPAAASVNFGGTTNFSVGAVGTGPLTYQWFRGSTALSNGVSDTGSGATISGANTPVLTIAAAAYQDAGSYSVIITNGAAATITSSSAVLTVKDPYIVTAPAATTVLVGNTATMSAVGNGSPTLSYQWLKGSTALVNGGSISGATTTSLTINPAASSDAGSYKLVVTSSGSGASVTSSSGVLTVQVAAGVTVSPAQRAQRVGDHLSFIATGTGTSPLSYQWDLNGSAIAGATTSVLALNDIQAGDAGTYSVTVNNVVGTPATASGVLNVSAGYLPLQSTNLIIARVGDGMQTLNNSVGNTLYLDQLQPDGTYVSTIMIPDNPTSAFGTDQSIAGVAMGQNIMMAAVGASDGVYENVLTRSANGGYINFGAYHTTVPSSTALTDTIRGVGAVNALGFYQLTYTNRGFYSGGNKLFRSVVSEDGQTNFWTTGAASSAGIKYAQWYAAYANGNNIPAVSGSFTNTRVVDIVSGNVVFSDWGDNSSTNSVGLNAFNGLPKPSSSAVASSNILAMASGAQPTDFAFSPDLQTVYIADDRSFDGTQKGGIQRWDTNAVSGGWSWSYTLAVSNTVGSRSLTVDWSASPTWGSNVFGAVIYATTAAASKNSLVKIVDTGEGATGNVLMTAGANQLLRGVRFGPVPLSAAVSLANKLVATTSNAVFSANVSGDAPFTYQWTKGAIVLSDGPTGNGSTIVGSSTATLTIVNVAAADMDTYSISVSNALPSTASASATLTVIDGVTITTQPTDSTVQFGGNATFTVAAAGGGTISYQWRRNGSNLAEGGVVSGATTSALTLTGVAAANEGSYTCVVSNEVTKVTSAVGRLTVQDPLITGDPNSLTRVPGRSASFNVTAIGTSPTYQWAKDGSPILNETNATLTIASVAPSDQGSYACTVGGTHPVTSFAATLTIIDPVSLTGPDNATASAGQGAMFTVVPSGTGPFTYSWAHGVDVLTDNGTTIIGASTASLTLGGVLAADAGDYTVTVNNADSTASATATLTVVDPAIVTQPQGTNIECGGSACLTVTANGTGTLTYQWLLEGSAITDATNSSYCLNNATVASGNYSVIVSNALGSSVTSDVAVVNVVDTEAPLITVNAGPSTLCIGDAFSDPGATANDACSGSVSVSPSGSVNTSAAGFYTLSYSATDASGNSASATRVVEVKVCADPNIVVQPAAAVYGVTGSSTTLHVEATGSAPFKYQWYWVKTGNPAKLLKKTINYAGVTTDTLTVSHLTAGQNGTYYCFVTNAIGSNNRTTDSVLTVLDTPKITITPKPSKKPTAGFDVTLTAKVTKGDVTVDGIVPKYQWYYNGVLMPGKNDKVLSLPDVQVNTHLGLYTFYVTNAATFGSNVLDLQVQADSKVPSSVLIKVPKDKTKATNGMPIALQTSVAPSVEISGQALDNGLITSITLNRTNPVTDAFNATFVNKDHTAAAPAVAGKTVYFMTQVELVDGTNVFYATVTDSAGLTRNSKAVSYYYMGQPSTVTIQTSGTGHVTGTKDVFFGQPATGALLDIGHNYTVKAIPQGLHVTFQKWTLSDANGPLPDQTANPLTFTMSPNLVITAVFSNHP